MNTSEWNPLTKKPTCKGYYIGWHEALVIAPQRLSMYYYDGWAWWTPEGFRGPPTKWAHASRPQREAAKRLVKKASKCETLKEIFHCREGLDEIAQRHLYD